MRVDQELIEARMLNAERRRIRQRLGSRRARPRRALPPFMLSDARARQRPTGIRLPHYLMLGVGLFSLLFVLSVISFTITSVAVAGATVRQYREVNDSLPNAGEVAAKSFRTTTIRDRTGVILQTVDQKEGGYRSFVPLDQISPYLIQATVASEDATYWSHHGVEPLAIVRGAVINVSGSGSSGGSTITQQLARGLFPRRSGRTTRSSARSARRWRRSLSRRSFPSRTS
jgi:membrane peptidoglycan carboxypeptidase